MNFEIVDQEIELLYQQSVANPQTMASYNIGGNPDYLIRVDVYTSINGNGFCVIAKVKQNNSTYLRIKNYGPETAIEQDWTLISAPY